ncbi:ABC transporter permease [Marinifilum caeruleilacunae]|uniref:ABC transporter permease n=1 Tax=Marinifilum caeruleilacunae TaxID=2499076 RepID=A0ABX1WS90_9BACT|nr:ABC transporter permease [Marinifilum caeruleilacunae]NOU58867.1 ABC transporter permease [Marinifilum caeruleilacunae]
MNMIGYYIKSAIKSLWANGKFSLINIIGFSFAISVCLAISLFVIHEYSYDKYHENGDRIYRLVDSKLKSSSIDYRTKDLLVENFPEIEKACILHCTYFKPIINVGNQSYYMDQFLSADADLFQVFDIPLILGNKEKPFTDLNSVLISESTSKLLFGDENPLGKEILYQRETRLVVTGVFKDMPESSSIKARFIANAAKKEFRFSFSCTQYADKSTHRYPFRIYFLLNEKSNPEDFRSKLVEKSAALQPYVHEADLLALKDMYLFDTTKGSQNKRGNYKLLQILGSIAVIILILAIVNYINLALAQQKKKNRISGIKKSYGASGSHLWGQFITEAILISSLAFLFAFLLLWMLSPVYALVFNIPFNIDIFVHPFLILALFASILLLGFLSGFAPAFILSKVSPISVMRDTNSKGSSKSYSRNALIVFQFSVSIALIVCVIIVERQMYYVKHKNLGFEPELLIRLHSPMQTPKDFQLLKSFVSEIQNNPNIENVSLTKGNPGGVTLWMGVGEDYWDQETYIPTIEVDTSFISTFKIKLIEGRNAQPHEMGKVCLVNQTFYDYFRMDNIIDKRYANYDDDEGYKIIGVFEDYNYSSLHEKIEPMAMILQDDQPNAVSLRINSNNISETMDYLKTSWDRVLSYYPVSMSFYKERYNKMYKKEERLGKTISLFALLAIAISCFGILGLSIFSAEQRTKEIGVRKTNGAKTYEIIQMLNRDFLKWVALSFLIASPIAWYIMNKWLQNFAYKIELSWWIFALAGIIALGIALLTVSWQSWRAANRNPVESLRYE